MYMIKNLVMKRNRNDNTTNVFINERNLLVVYETTFEELKLIVSNSCAVCY